MDRLVPSRPCPLVMSVGQGGVWQPGCVVLCTARGCGWRLLARSLFGPAAATIPPPSYFVRLGRRSPLSAGRRELLAVAPGRGQRISNLHRARPRSLSITMLSFLCKSRGELRTSTASTSSVGDLRRTAPGLSVGGGRGKGVEVPPACLRIGVPLPPEECCLVSPITS